MIVPAPHTVQATDGRPLGNGTQEVGHPQSSGQYLLSTYWVPAPLLSSRPRVPHLICTHDAGGRDHHKPRVTDKKNQGTEKALHVPWSHSLVAVWT